MATCNGDNIVQTIERTECIGNSLQKINSNFTGLDVAVCDLQLFNANLSDISGILKGSNQEIVQAIPGVDYLPGTTGLNGIMKINSAGTVSIAVSGTDYYAPRTSLVAYDTTILGTLSTTGIAWFDTVYSKKDVVAFSTSDERLKTNVNVILNPLEKIESIKGVEYTWNKELQDTFEGKDIGVLAQDVEKILPEAVIEREDGYKGVRYEKLIPLLIECVKCLKAEVEELKSKIKE
jgi:hypothetical protein